jgi:hypothetical protein
MGLFNFPFFILLWQGRACQHMVIASARALNNKGECCFLYECGRCFKASHISFEPP